MQPGQNFECFMGDITKILARKAKEENLIKKMDQTTANDNLQFDPNDDKNLKNYKTSNMEIQEKLNEYQIEKDLLISKEQQRDRSKSKQKERPSATKQFLEGVDMGLTKKEENIAEIQDYNWLQEDLECTFTPEIDINSKLICNDIGYEPIYTRYSFFF